MSPDGPDMPALERSTSKSGHLSTPIQIPHHVLSPNHSRWQSRPSSIALGLTLFVCFALAAAQVGLASYELQRHGNSLERWDNLAMVKHLVGLTLFNAIFTLLFVLGSYWIPPLLALFLVFGNSTIWIVDAGLLNQASPMRVGHCGRGANFPAGFRTECHEIVAMEALAWTLWGLLLFVLVYLLHRTLVGARRKDHRHTLYGV